MEMEAYKQSYRPKWIHKLKVYYPSDMSKEHSNLFFREIFQCNRNPSKP